MKYHIFKINITILNVLSTVLLLLAFLFTYLLFPNIFDQMLMLFSNDNFIIMLLPLMIGYFILHELLHALGYIINGADPKKITFGMEIEKSVLYCLCKTEVDKKNILFSLMYPLFFIGIVTYIIGIIFSYPILVLLSILNISGAAGDIMYFLFIMKLDKDIKYSEMDDGTSFAIISKNDPSKVSHPGLIYEGTVTSIPRNDFKRIKISKLSMAILILCIIAILVALFM